MRFVVRHAAAQFQEQFIGHTVEVLWENRRNGLWRGLTDNYLRVLARSDKDLAQRITPVRLVTLTDDGFHGVLP